MLTMSMAWHPLYCINKLKKPICSHSETVTPVMRRQGLQMTGELFFKMRDTVDGSLYSAQQESIEMWSAFQMSKLERSHSGIT